MRFIEKHPMIMIVIGVMGISLSAIFVRLSQAPSAVTAAWRLCWTVLLMTPVVFGSREVRQELLSIRKKTAALSLLSGLFLAAHFFTWFESLQFTSVSSSTTIVCTEVIWVSIGFCLFLGGRLNRKEILTIAVAFAGSACIAFADSAAGGMHLYGDLLALLAAITVAVYMLLGRVVRADVSTSVYTYLVYVACAGALLLMCAFQGHSLVAYGGRAVLVGLLLAVFSTILGHSIFSWCLKYFSPSFVSASKLCEPVVAAVMAGFLFGEIPTALQVVGGILIIGSVFYYSRIEKAQ